MNIPLHLALVLMGFTFTITQVMVIREFLVVFIGNELSIAIILANWLLLEAAGSFLFGKKVEEWGLREGGYALVQLIISILLPLTIYGIRSIRDLFGLPPGEGASLFQIFFWTVPVLAPIGIIDGILFALGCTLHAKWAETGAPSIGRVYLWEALGAGTGGILYTFLFIPFFSSFQVAFILGAANLLSGLLLLVQAGEHRKRRKAFSGLLTFLLIADFFLLTPSVSQWIEEASWGRLWRGWEVLQSRWSPYGNVTVGRREEQLTFFSNGIPICNVPIPHIAFAEELVHYPLLLIPSPQSILIVGGGFGGVIHEVLKHPVVEVNYAEIDPLIVQLIGENLTPLTRKELEDPRVRVRNEDGRLYIKTTPKKFDVIILNLPGPSTLELNRFYTVEFFREAFQRLTEKGVLALSMPGSETYLGPEVRDLNLSLLRPLQEVFPWVSIIPGDPNFILTSPAKDLGPLTPKRLVAGLRERKIQTQFLTDFHIQRKLEKQRQEWLEESLKQGTMVRLNRDAAPSGLYYGIAYWNAQFHPPMQLFWGWIDGLRLGHIGLTLFLLVVMGFIWGRTFDGRRGRGAIIWVLITTGFFGTGMTILLIFSFQTLYGYTYQWIGLLVAFFMVGLALGSWRMTRAIGKLQSCFRTLIRVEIIILSFGTFGLLLLTFFYAAKTEVFILQLVKFGFLFLSLISGLLVGLEFPLSSRILAGSVGGVGRPAGILYASDLFGAWAGSLLVGVILIPVLGIFQTCGAIILLKIVSLSLMVFSSRRWTEQGG